MIFNKELIIKHEAEIETLKEEHKIQISVLQKKLEGLELDFKYVKCDLIDSQAECTALKAAIAKELAENNFIVENPVALIPTEVIPWVIYSA